MIAPSLRAFTAELLGTVKLAKVLTPLQSHQERVVNRMKRDDQPGLVVAHGLGSGKTLTSISAIDALGGTAAVLVPASLADNYRKELSKHTDGKPNPAVISLQRTALQGKAPDADVLVVDEAHRARETKTKTYKAIRDNTAKKRMLLTASPFYNRPSDIAPLVNMAAGYNIFPNDPTEFKKRYIKDKKVSPGLWGKLKGIKPGSVPTLNPKEKKWLSRELGHWVDYHAGSKEGFPDVTYEDVKVPLSKEQRKIYDTLINKAPPWMRHKVRKGMPPSKQESKQLNAFMTALRQVSLSTAPFITKGESSEAKVEAAFQNMKKTLGDDKKSKVVVYSNYLEAGLNPYKKRLDAEGVAYGEFSGKMKKKDRDQTIRDYNEGKIRALLLSSAGGEGLDLKGTSVIQVLEPHWNREKIRQVEGRAIRYKSHDHLPEDKRNVVVQRYLGTIPRTKVLEKMRLRDPGSGADEYLSMLSDKKDALNQQFKDLLTGIDKEGSDAQRAFYASTKISPYYAKKQRDKRKQQEANRLLKKAGFLRERVREGNSNDLIGRMTKKRRQIEKMAGACVRTLTWGGLTMKFEYLKDDVRSGTGEGGKKWSRKMKDCYGYIPGTYGKGADGEAIDVYFHPEPLDGPVFRIHQLTKEGKFDEDKFMVGYGSAVAARAAFARNMPKWAFGDITSLSMKSFRTLVGQDGRKVRVPSDGNAERERVRKAMERKTT